ncbi:hypothetical protein GW932_00130 [archaeon]|nr:hypothetical protein [archaeon]
MEIKNLLNGNLNLSDLENHEISKNTSAFDGLGKEKVEALKKSISEINDMVKGREFLSNQIFEEGEKIKNEINSLIMENERTPLADKRDVMREKNDLNHKKIEISELQLNERISCWKDIAQLKKELREYERELNEKEERSKMFAKIMEEN